MTAATAALAPALLHATRALRRSLETTIVALLWVAIGIGVATTVSAVVDAAVSPSSPLLDPDHLLVAYADGYQPWGEANVFALYRALVASGSASGLRAEIEQSSLLSTQTAGWLDDVPVAAVSPGFLSLLGARPVRGRIFSDPLSADELQATVIGEDLWNRAFHRSAIAGARLTIDGRSYEVIGVMPRALSVELGTQAWVPVPPSQLASGDGLAWARLYLRAGPSAAPAVVKSRLETLFSNLPVAAGEMKATLVVRSGRTDALGVRDVHWAMIGAAVAVWLTTCANLAGLMLARSVSRRRDFALQAALGATRGDIARQMALEATIISLAGAGVGLLLSVWASSVLASRTPVALRALGIAPPQLSWRVYASAVALAALSAMLFGLLPALGIEIRPAETLKESAGTVAPRGLRRHRAFAVGQVAVSVLLVSAAALLGRSVDRIREFDFGYDTRGLLAGVVLLPRLQPGKRPAQLTGFPEPLADRVRQVPGVEQVGLWGDGGPQGGVVTSDDAVHTRVARVPRYVFASPELLGVLRVPVRHGRGFTLSDRLGVGALVIDERLARQLWPSGRAVGSHLRLGSATSGGPWIPVVGVVPRVALEFKRDPDLARDPVVFYLPPANIAPWSQLVLRVDPHRLGLALTGLRSIRDDLPGTRGLAVRSWTRAMENFLTARRFVAGVFDSVSALGVLLMALGLYSILSRSVAQRLREFAIRMALGATRQIIVQQVMREAGMILLGGLMIGLPLALYFGGLLAALLYDVEPTDIRSLLIGALVIAAVTSAAALQPALRAARSSPNTFIRAI